MNNMSESDIRLQSILRMTMTLIEDDDADRLQQVFDGLKDELILLTFPQCEAKILLQLFLIDASIDMKALKCTEFLMNQEGRPGDVETVEQASEPERDEFGEEEENASDMQKEYQCEWSNFTVTSDDFPPVVDLVAKLLAREEPSLTKWVDGLEEMPISGFDAFYIAANSNEISVVKYMLSNGCNANQVSHIGTNVFNGIIMKRNMDMLQVFMDYQVELAGDANGRTPLHCAAKKKDLEMAEILLEECNADPNCKDSRGDTPLHIAAKLGDSSMIEMLVEYGADFDDANEYGLTAFHYAAAYGKLEALEILYDYGVDIYATTKQGMHALNIAVMRKKKACIRWLEELGLVNDAPVKQSSGKRNKSKGKKEAVSVKDKEGKKDRELLKLLR